MRKVLYVSMAIVMSVITLILSPMKTYAAGNTLQYARNFTSYLRSYIQYNSATVADDYIPQDTDINTNQYANFNGTVTVSLENRSVSNDAGFHYVSGYFKTNFIIPFSMNSNATLWAFSYDVEYSNVQEGVSMCIARCYASGNSVVFVVYYILDNVMIYDNMAHSLGSIALNLHFETKKPASQYESYLTFDSAQSESEEHLAIHYDTSPSPLMGTARVLELAVERALDYTVTQNIDNIAEWLYVIYSTFPSYTSSVLSYLSSIYNNTSAIMTRLLQMYNQDDVFYRYVMSYLESANVTEASEAVQEATEIQQVASSMAAELEQTQPDISEAFSYIDSQVDTEKAQQVFSFLGSGSIITTIMLITMCLAIMGYVLYGRR